MRETRRRLLSLVGAMLLLAPACAFAQNPVTINGRVTSSTGGPLPFAEISIPTLGVGALTRDDGRYAIFIPAARVSGQSVQMTVRRLGYKPQTVTVPLTQSLIAQDFSLATNPLQLGEVVVTGAGTAQTAEKLGNVRNAVSAEQIEKSNEQNVVEALAGKAPNVQVTGQSGDPGASSFIQIRGIRTIVGNSQPLFVVDGVPLDNSATSTSSFNPHDGGYSGEGTVVSNRAIDLNPNDIENVEILKGAAAGAIYGARAGQGVVLITTKAGRAGATRFSLRSTASFDNVNHFIALQTKYGQGRYRYVSRRSVRRPRERRVSALLGPATAREPPGVRSRPRTLRDWPRRGERHDDLGWERPPHVLPLG